MDNLPFKEEVKQIFLLMGIQASGKTTFYHQILERMGFAHISLDEVRTRSRETQMVTDCLKRGQSFVVDNTNPQISDRARYINQAKEYNFKVIGLFFQSIVKDCVKRNADRGMKVPSKAIACTSNKLQLPTKTEGFDELYFVRIINNKFNISTWRE